MEEASDLLEAINLDEGQSSTTDNDEESVLGDNIMGIMHEMDERLKGRMKGTGGGKTNDNDRALHGRKIR